MKDKKRDPEEFEIEDLREKDPFVKKAAKFSAFIYLGLAILVVIVATVGIFSISYSDEMPQVSVPMAELNDISIPDIKIPDKPVRGDQSGVTADISLPDLSEKPDETSDAPSKPTFFRPVNGKTVKDYSMDALVFSATMKDYRVHSGIDIEAPVGSEVVAYTDGKVISVRDDYFYGTTVAIQHAEGVVSYYMNLDPTLKEGIKEGVEVKAGQAIGSVGTGARIESADASHLHFELRVNGSLTDPAGELPE